MSHTHYRLKPTLVVGLLTRLLFTIPCSAQTHQYSHSQNDPALRNVLKQYLKDQDVENDSPTRYIAAFVDLNDDGKKEVIVHLISQSLCGTGGCPTLILVPQQSSYSIVSRITITHPPIRVLKVRSNGWHDLAVWVGGGGIQPGYEADLPFDGESYATNPTVPPAHQLSSQSAGRVVISDNAASTPLN
jgi:hypothetical protein